MRVFFPCRSHSVIEASALIEDVCYTSPGRGSVSHSGHEHQGPGKPANHLCCHLKSKVETRDGVNERDIFRASSEHLETAMWGSSTGLFFFSV